MSRSRRLAGELCFGDGLFETSDDEGKASRVLAGRIDFRGSEVAFAQWHAPDNVPESLLPAWKFFFHSLVWVDPLRRVGGSHEAYLEKYREYVFGWLHDHGSPPSPLPTLKQPGDYTWYDMAVAWRALVILGAISILKLEPSELDFLEGHLRQHMHVLAADESYAQRGNHALHQSNGLLSAALYFGELALIELALSRIRQLLSSSFDDEGVNLEGSPAYHAFNMFWWFETKRRLEIARTACPNIDVPEMADMRPFLRHVIAPDGKYALLGDTIITRSAMKSALGDRFPRHFIGHLEADPALRYVLTCGAEGARPAESSKAFRAGYWFSRSASADGSLRDSHCSMCFDVGIARLHGHDDAGSVTYYPRGYRLIEDGGMYGYYGGALREFVKSPAAHNVIVVPGAKYYRSAVSELLFATETGAIHTARVNIRNIERTTWHRQVVHVCAEDFLIVQDIFSTRAQSLYQGWNIGDGCEIANLVPGRCDVQQGENRASFFWLGDTGDVSVVSGRRSPLAGWRSTFEGEAHPIRSVRVSPTSAKGKLTTVIVPLPASLEFESVEIVGHTFRTSETLLRLRADKKVFRVRFTVQGEASAEEERS
jgi:hypothetical protein